MPHRPKPPLLFRSAVILGCVALLVGVAGIFYFNRADETQEAVRRGDAAVVVIHGLASVEGIRLVARWHDVEQVEREETGKPGDEGGHWVFLRAPEGTPLTLQVLRYADGGKSTVHEMPAVLTRGGLFEVWMPGGR